MKKWQIMYKGKPHVVECDNHEEAILALGMKFPELAVRDNWYIASIDHFSGKISVNSRLSYYLRNDLKEQAKEAPTALTEEEHEDRFGTTEFAKPASKLLDELALQFNLDLIKQQIDEALARSDFDRCRELYPELQKYNGKGMEKV